MEALVVKYLKNSICILKFIPFKLGSKLINLIYFEKLQSQSAFACSKFTIETLIQGVKYVHS